MRRRDFLASAVAAAATPFIAACGAKKEMEIETPPQDLLSFGSSFALGDGAGAGQTVTLRKRRGAVIDLRSGALTVADPWFPANLPGEATIGLPRGRQPTLLSTIDFMRDGKPATLACAAAIGRASQAKAWQSLIRKGESFSLNSDSALGGFYDMADAAALRPLFEDDQHMQGVYERALDEHISVMAVDGRVGAVVFLCPDGAATYPVYAGLDRNGRAVAVLVDFKILNPQRPWNSLTPARRVAAG